MVFHSASGPLTVNERIRATLWTFPLRPSEPILRLPDWPKRWASFPIEVFENAFNYMAVLQSSHRSCVRLLLIWRRSRAWTAAE